MVEREGLTSVWCNSLPPPPPTQLCSQLWVPNPQVPHQDIQPGMLLRPENIRGRCCSIYPANTRPLQRIRYLKRLWIADSLVETTHEHAPNASYVLRWSLSAEENEVVFVSDPDCDELIEDGKAYIMT
jgi:hypothetical protein